MEDSNRYSWRSANWLRNVSPSLRPKWVGPGRSTRCVGNGTVPPNYTVPLRVIYDHELLMYRDSEHLVVIDEVEYTCPPDSFIIIPPGKWHYMLNPSEQDGRHYWNHFDWNWQDGHAKTPVMCFAPTEPKYHLCRRAPASIPDKTLYGRLQEPASCFTLAERMAALMDSGSVHDHMLAGAVLWELLIQLLDRPEGKSEQPKGEITLAGRIRDVLDQAARDQPEQMVVQLLLESFDYSYEHLCRAFKKAYAIPPTQYLLAQRVIQAKALLRNTDLRVAEIAYRTGFNSPSYFTKVFHSLIGVTPSHLRKQEYRVAPMP